MGRATRLQVGGQIYHVLNRGNEKQTIFHDNLDYVFFYNILRKFKAEHNIKIYRYVFMPNHIHLLVEPQEDMSLAVFMKKLQQKFSKYYQSRYKTVGHVWQGRYKSFPVEDDSYFIASSLYIEMNPVRAKIVEQPENYSWSSYAYYNLRKDDLLVDSHPLLPRI